ncbi:glycosyltransferase [Rhodobacter sp. Har01]|nr:glycosyltransferase [Rhodobacter sp. Har01]MCB6178698.1 glycosyltransferase [Rhodobacter sp. Har01]
MTAVHAPDPFRRAARPADPGLASGAACARRAAKFHFALLREGLLKPEDLAHALTFGEGRSDRMLPRGAVAEDRLLEAASRHFAVAEVDPLAPLPDPALIDRVGAQDCLRYGLVPWRRAGSATVVVTARPDTFDRLRPMLEARLGPVLMALAPISRIEQAIHARRGARLAQIAEQRVTAAESCRNWSQIEALPWVVSGLLLAAALLYSAPLLVFRLALAAAVISLVLSMALKIAAAVAALRPAPPEPPAPILAQLPQVSVIVALYRESDIAPRLVRRLSRLDYPRDRLDVILAVEADDARTREALASADLPPWMRVVVVPAGQVRTKPRALDLALDHCRGSIIGIYDAEDAPEPDQIRKVVDRFHRRGPDVACLQGVLDYYNPRTNWLSRCFTIEYANWFRLMLPGVARLGLVVPLGGTTLFFRRAVLEELGAWDAHNVTEDADLGVRLVRHGYRTEVLDTVTGEEANCRVLPWIKQRSRWIKGYMLTWAVHMRSPLLLWRQLGAWRFAGFQVMFLGTILQFLLAPVLWSFWAVPLGLGHPLGQVLTPVGTQVLISVFLLTEAVNAGLALIALRRSRHQLSPLWIFTLAAYFPLAAFAAYKGLWETLRRPFYWDKTHHGLFDAADLPG